MLYRGQQCQVNFMLQTVFVSVLSPLLFKVYVNDRSECLHKSGAGGSMNGTFVNHMLYADDICIISLSSTGLQRF